MSVCSIDFTTRADSFQRSCRTPRCVPFILWFRVCTSPRYLQSYLSHTAKLPQRSFHSLTLKPIPGSRLTKSRDQRLSRAPNTHMSLGLLSPPEAELDFPLPPLERRCGNSSPSSNTSESLTKTFYNCPKPAPADCNGHGKRAGVCYCVCDPGYGPVYKDGHVESWCVRGYTDVRIIVVNSTENGTSNGSCIFDSRNSSSGSVGSSSAGGLWDWLDTPMGASIAVITSSFILVVSAFICLCCYRKYKAKLAARDSGGGGDGAEQGAAGSTVSESSRHRSSASSHGRFFETWSRRKRAQVQQQNHMELQQRHLRSSQRNGSSIAASTSSFDLGGRSLGSMEGGSDDRRATGAALHDAGLTGANAMIAAQLLYLQQQQQQQLVRDRPDQFGRKSRGSTSFSGSSRSRSYVNPLALETVLSYHVPEVMHVLPPLRAQSDRSTDTDRASAQRPMPVPSSGPMPYNDGITPTQRYNHWYNSYGHGCEDDGEQPNTWNNADHQMGRRLSVEKNGSGGGRRMRRAESVPERPDAGNGVLSSNRRAVRHGSAPAAHAVASATTLFRQGSARNLNPMYSSTGGDGRSRNRSRSTGVSALSGYGQIERISTAQLAPPPLAGPMAPPPLGFPIPPLPPLPEDCRTGALRMASRFEHQ